MWTWFCRHVSKFLTWLQNLSRVIWYRVIQDGWNCIITSKEKILRKVWWFFTFRIIRWTVFFMSTARKSIFGVKGMVSFGNECFKVSEINSRKVEGWGHFYLRTFLRETFLHWYKVWIKRKWNFLAQNFHRWKWPMKRLLRVKNQT